MSDQVFSAGPGRPESADRWVGETQRAAWEAGHPTAEPAGPPVGDGDRADWGSAGQPVGTEQAVRWEPAGEAVGVEQGASWDPAGGRPGQAGTGETGEEITSDTRLGAQDSVTTPSGTQVQTRDGTATVTTADGSVVTVPAQGDVTIERPAMDPLAEGNADRVAAALAGGDVSAETEQIALAGDGSYQGADGFAVEVVDGVVTVTTDGDRVTVGEDGATAVEVSPDPTGADEAQREAERLAEEAEQRADEATREAEQEAREAEREAKREAREAEAEAKRDAEQAGAGAPSGGGGAVPSGGGGAPSGGGGGAPSGGGGGAEPSGGAPSGGSPTGGGPMDDPAGYGGSRGSSTIEVSPAAMRADAQRWDTLSDRFSEIHQGADALELSRTEFGLAAPLHGGYDALVGAFTQMSSTGADQFTAIARTLRRNAQDYDSTEAENVAAAGTTT